MASASSPQHLVKESFVAYQKRQRKQKELFGTELTEAVPIVVSLCRLRWCDCSCELESRLQKLIRSEPCWKTANPCLTDTSHLPQDIPFNLEQETELLREEVAAADYCVIIFDGSTCQRETLTSLRYVDGDWCFQPAAHSISCYFKELVRSATCL